MRNCSVCGCADQAQLSGDNCRCSGGEVIGHTPNCPAIEHYVAKEVMPVRNLAQFEAQGLKRKGYTYSEEYSRPHGFRYTCRMCLRKMSEVADIKASIRKAQDEAMGGNLTHHQIYTL